MYPSIPVEVPISHDALRMRTRRLCEKKSSGRCGVPESIHSDYVTGGEAREILEMALLQAIATHGVQRNKYKKIKVPGIEMWFAIVSYKVHMKYLGGL